MADHTRQGIRRQIRSQSQVEAYRRLVQHTFPSSALAGFQLAFLRPFAVPEMADVLVATRRTTSDAWLRAYRTGLQMYEVIDGALDSVRARRVLSHINRVHAHHHIDVDQYRYVLNAIIVVPTRHIGTFGHRPLTEAERDATVAFGSQLGRRLGIPGTPGTYREAESEFDEYERCHARPSPSTLLLGEANLAVLRRRLPAPLRPLAPHLFAGRLNDSLIGSALGLPRADPRVVQVLKLAGRVEGPLDALRYRRRPYFRPGQPSRAFPAGYQLEELLR